LTAKWCTVCKTGKLTVALIAIHALPGADIRWLRLDDLDRHRGRLTVARAGRTHVVYLDELTLNLATAWLQERTRRWPRTTNPHLLLTQQSATDNRDRPMHACTPTGCGRGRPKPGHQRGNLG
jgi:hypothetical protein